jgi:acyl-CoA dehydrogenase
MVEGRRLAKEDLVGWQRTRKQFGVSIGSFQVLQHCAADMLIALEETRSMCMLATMLAVEPDAAERRRAITSAKVQTGRSGRFIDQQAIQLHGDIGMTMEYKVGHYFKRVTVFDTLFGAADPIAPSSLAWAGSSRLEEGAMLQTMTPRTEELSARIAAFMDEHVYPAEPVFQRQLDGAIDRWDELAIMAELKAKAKAAGLWNLFLPKRHYPDALSNLEYAPLCEIMGRSPIGSESFNCSAPDTGNMETLILYGNEEQKRRWLKPLMDGDIRSCFAMTEPAVASSDATNIRAEIRREGDDYVINGRKWWTSGAMDRRCKIAIVMGLTDPAAEPHRRQSMVLVPLDTPGVKVVRALSVFGYDDAPHGHAEVLFENVRVPVSNILLGEGRGFEIAQGRLGPGRIHHCMRLIGVAERALETLCQRALDRSAFGRAIADHGVTRHWIAESRMEIDQARLLTLNAAHMMDTVGNKAARAEIAMIKVVAPNMAQKIIERAIQVCGGAGVSQDFHLAYAWARTRVLRLADGPDEVHRETIAKKELRKYLSNANQKRHDR